MSAARDTEQRLPRTAAEARARLSVLFPALRPGRVAVITASSADRLELVASGLAAVRATLDRR